jgi:hypothetical protein
MCAGTSSARWKRTATRVKLWRKGCRTRRLSRLPENERRVLDRVDSSEPPPDPGGPQGTPRGSRTANRRRTCALHPRSDQRLVRPCSLASSVREAWQHDDAAARSRAACREPGVRCGGGPSTGLAGEPTDEPATDGKNALVALRVAASNAVSECWARVTEGHSPPAESEQMYLRRLVERIRKQDLV